MFNGVFKEQGANERAAKECASDSPRELTVAAEQALAELLASRELRPYALSRHCELGPFLIEYVFTERSLIVELLPGVLAPDSIAHRRHQARVQFLGAMGYAVLGVSPREILRHPRRVMARLRAALEHQVRG